MRTKLILMAVMAAASAQAEPFIFIPFAGTNTITPAWWTTSKTNATDLLEFEGWQGVNENFRRASNNMASLSNTFTALVSGLPDAATNSVLNSYRVPAIASNSVTITAGQTNYVGWVTNLAGVSYTVTVGSPKLVFSYDGTNWSDGDVLLVTNTRVRIAFGSGTKSQGDPPVQVPADGGMTNLVVYRMVRPDLFGRTNAIYGEHLFAGTPTDPSDVVPKEYVDGLFSKTAWWSAEADVQMNSHTLQLSPNWAWGVETPNTNSDLVALRFFGQNLLSVETKPPSLGNINDIWVGAAASNICVMVTTNGVTAAPALEFTHLLSPLNWSWIGLSSSTYPTVTNHVHVWHNFDQDMNPLPDTYSTNYGFQLSFTMPQLDQGYVRVGFASSDPAVMMFNGLGIVGSRTITNATGTTWGRGAGLFCADSNYVYISVGSNAWKRAALSTW